MASYGTVVAAKNLSISQNKLFYGAEGRYDTTNWRGLVNILKIHLSVLVDIRNADYRPERIRQFTQNYVHQY